MDFNEAPNNQSATDSLALQIKRTEAFFAPENLAALTLKYEGEIALLVIDVQKEFCDPAAPQRRGNAETETVSERIQSLVPEFRKAHIPVYAVYFSTNGEKPASDVDFYKFTPDKEDVLVAKNRDSAFAGSNIRELLERDHKKLLLTCGFNQAACVLRTVIDARTAGFEVCLLEDLAGNDNFNSAFYADNAAKEMQQAGVIKASSQTVLGHLNAPGLQLTEQPPEHRLKAAAVVISNAV